MFQFKILKTSRKTLARRGEIETVHGKIQTPAFLPCATAGAVKGITFEELKNLGFKLILNNTYHLYLRPGEKLIKKLGGLHQFINWSGPILTDSGGYQIFSLEAKLKKDGVVFRSPLNGSLCHLTPKKVIDIQRNLGSDIMMVLDVCSKYPISRKKAQEEMVLTHRWARQALDYWQKNRHSKQALFGIIQGSIYQDLRIESTQFISNLAFDGIAVGGVSVGEGKNNMRKVLQWVGPTLPKNKPHYLMGVGEPEDIIEAVKFGFDMFDCVLPTRLGRHGAIWQTSDWQKFEKIDLHKSKYRQDKRALMKGCCCPSCHQGYSRAYLAHLLREKEIAGIRLTTLHNLSLIQELLRRIRAGI